MPGQKNCVPGGCVRRSGRMKLWGNIRKNKTEEDVGDGRASGINNEEAAGREQQGTKTGGNRENTDSAGEKAGDKDGDKAGNKAGSGACASDSSDSAWERAWREADMVNSENGTKKRKEKFSWNIKYLTICLYAILVVLASVLIIKAFISWETTTAYFKGFFSVLSPFLWGAFIAFLINPLVKLFDVRLLGKIKPLKKRDKPRRILSLLFSYLIVMLSVLLVCVYLLPQIGLSLTEIINQIPKWIIQVNEWLMDFEKSHPEFDYEIINDFLNSLTPQLMDLSKTVVTGIVPIIFTTSISVVKGLVNVLIALMVSVYIITDKRILAKGFKRILYAVASDRTADVIMETLRECYHIFSQFIFGKAVDSLIIGCICFIVMSLFRFPFAPIISLIVGITNMIPYFGPFIGAVPGVILIFLVDPLWSLFFIILIVVIQQFDGLYLGPRILGETVGMRPLWIIFAITVGGSIGGVVGMFLGVPVVAVIAYLLDKLLDRLARKKNVDINGKID